MKWSSQLKRRCEKWHTYQHVLSAVPVSTETLPLPPEVIDTDTTVSSTRVELLRIPGGHTHLVAGPLVAVEGVVPEEVRSVRIGEMYRPIPRAGDDLPVS